MPASECAPQPEVDGHHVGIGRAVLVRTDAERGAERATDEDQEAAAATLGRRLLGHRRFGAEVALDPAFGRVDSSIPGKHAHPTEPDLVRHHAQLIVNVHVVQRRVAVGPEARDQPVIVRVRRQQIAGTQVTGADPLRPRDPLGGPQGLTARKQDDLVHRDHGSAGRARQRDRPVPTRGNRPASRRSCG